MKPETDFSSRIQLPRRTPAAIKGLFFFTAVTLVATIGARAADEAAIQRLLNEARAKEAHAQELRAAAGVALQKAADDQMEASGEERESRVLTAQALKLMGADANKQRAFKLRQEARRLWVDDHNMLIAARNDEQKAAQLTHNAQELRKSVAELKDQPTIAASLEAEAKQAETDAQNATQLAGQAKFGAQSLEERAKNAWAEAEKLDPETHRLVAPPTAKPVVAQPHQVH